MCGIVGLANLTGLGHEAAESRLRVALMRLAPRGPDGEGTWSDGHCAFGHRRLAIVELTPAGAQPMTRGPLTIAFNGMIYNFRALRAELAEHGHRFTSDSDTEVLLAGWREWGEALLPRLIGMFAFALWDSERRELVLVRDRFGKKPLVYRRNGERLSFASELSALQLADGGGGDIDPAVLRHYFTLRYVPEPHTILRGVHKLPPGHIARFGAHGFTVERWYDLADARAPRYTDENEAADDLRSRVEASVRDRLTADVPVGAFLSGGIDSAIVAACMIRAETTAKTFTVGFKDAPDYFEERPAARAVADYLGTAHTEIEVAADDTRGLVEQVFDGLDEPFADASAVPTFLVSRETRQHVTVALSGDGADEVFGGYRKYQGELQAERYQRLPQFLRDGVIEPAVARLPEGKSTALLEKARQARRFAAHAGKDPAGRQAGWMRLLSDETIDALVIPPAEIPSLEWLIACLREDAKDDDPLNAMLAADIALVLPGDMLVKVDRMSMANSLEVRCPFLDHRVVECAAAMPGRFKLRRGTGKHILRRASGTPCRTRSSRFRKRASSRRSRPG